MDEWEGRSDGSAMAWAMKRDWAMSEGQFAMRMGRPTKVREVGGWVGEREKMSW